MGRPGRLPRPCARCAARRRSPGGAAPRNLANAFETEIRAKTGESLTRKSADALAKKGAALEKAYPRKGKTFVLNLADADLNGFGTAKDSLDDVLADVLNAVKD